jgi:PQQ-dependent catabolism-associated CXXCW motif protein
VPIASAALFTAAVAYDPKHFDPVTGFRIERYRAPTPEMAPGATTISVDDVRRLVKDESAVLVDVMAAEGAGPDPKTGAWRLSRKREHIPSSIWLPDVGKGDLNPAMDRYFRTNLDRITQGDRAHALIIYCLADCWMGWNAAKRAAAYGYTRVYWFPGGTDDWRDWEGSLVTAMPVPVVKN